MKTEKRKRRRVNISKIMPAGNEYVFWYDVDGVNRKIIRGTMKFVTKEINELIDKYKNDTLIVRK